MDPWSGGDPEEGRTRPDERPESGRADERAVDDRPTERWSASELRGATGDTAPWDKPSWGAPEPGSSAGQTGREPWRPTGARESWTPGAATRETAPAAPPVDPLARRPLESQAAYERRLAEQGLTSHPTPEPEDVRPAPAVRRLRKGRLAIRKINPWSVLRFSLVFYFCMLLIFLLGTALVFGTMKAFGVVDNAEKVLRNLQINVDIEGGTIFRWLFLVGLAGTVVASAITVFMSFLYNLIADVVGGIEVLAAEREQG